MVMLPERVAVAPSFLADLTAVALVQVVGVVVNPQGVAVGTGSKADFTVLWPNLGGLPRRYPCPSSLTSPWAWYMCFRSTIRGSTTSCP